MQKLIIWMEDVGKYEGEELEDRGNNTDFEYSIGETIRVNGEHQYKCMKKEVVNGKLYQYFKRGIAQYNFDY